MLLIKECEEYLSNQDGEQPQSKCHRTENLSKESSQPKSTLWTIYNDMLKMMIVEIAALATKADLIVEMYLKEPIQPRDEKSSPLEYWKVNKNAWSPLAY